MKLVILINFLLIIAVAISANGEDLTNTMSSTQDPPMGVPESESVDILSEEEHTKSCTGNNNFEWRRQIPRPNEKETETKEENKYVDRTFDDLDQINTFAYLLNFEVRIKNLNLTLVYTPNSFLEELKKLEFDMFLRCFGNGKDVPETVKQFQRPYAAMYMKVSHLMDKYLPIRNDTCPEHVQKRLKCLQQFGKTEKEMMKWLQEDNNSENSNHITVPRPLAKVTKGISKASDEVFINSQKRFTNIWRNIKVDQLKFFALIYDRKIEEKGNLNLKRNELFGEQNSYSLHTVKEYLIFEPDLILTVMAAYIDLYMKFSYYVENNFHTMDPIGGDLNHTLAQRCNFLESFQTASNETMIWALEQREDGAEDYYTFDIHEKREQDKKVIQDYLFNPMDVFLRNSSGSNFCRELTPLGIFTDDKSDVTFDIYGRKCIKPCTDYGRYWYCYYSDYDWHYCSPKGHTKKGENCTSKCTQGQNTSYYWCKTNNSWNTCSPYL